MMNNLSFSKPAPEHWVANIKDMLEDEDVAVTSICVHKVPQIVRAVKPEAYTPQFIGLGPYHHWRDDLYEMEQCKLIAAKKSQKACHNDDEAVQMLDHLVECIGDDIAQIRACYDRHLDINNPSLAWMMMIDGIFLLQFLQAFIDPKESCLSFSKRTAYLLDPYQSAYHSILKDIIKLENQIPIFILYHIMKASCDIANQSLVDMMLLAACKKLTPFKCDKSNLSRGGVTSYAHLLELLYYSIVCEHKLKGQDHPCRDDHGENDTNKNHEKLRKNCLPNVNIPPPKLEAVRNLPFVHTIANSKPLKVIGPIASLVTTIFPSIGNLSSSKPPMGNDPENSGNSSCTTGTKEGAPKIEEIEIPSVSSLSGVGINFCPTDDLLTSIKFDKKSKTFHLPVVTIDANTEVVIRNLVAYEAEAISGPSVLGRFTELMNGIIDTPEDVKLLRQRNIIVSYLKNDEDVAQLWNGMSRTIRLTHVKTMDKAIKEVNEYYNNKTRVKFIRFSKDCMFCGWRILMLVLALVLMVLMSIQSFCDVYRCPKVLQPVATAKG